jgi:glycogen(starch) synthase
MRILIWTDGFWPQIGGLEFFCMRIVAALKERGHTCAVLTEQKVSAEVIASHYQDIPVYGFPFELAFRSGNLPLLRRHFEACARLLEEFQPDVVHLNAVMRGAIGFLLEQRRRRLRTVLTLHDNSLAQHARGLGPGLLDAVDIIAAISQWNRAYIAGCDPRVEARLRVIPNALPSPAVAPAPLPATFRLLGLGRLVREKGFDLAIRAFAEVAQRFPESTLTLAGEGKDAETLRQLAAKTGLGSRIHFTGWVDPENVPALINQHSAVIMPSRWQEPFGLVALQAAQMGRAIIASDSGALPEIVVDGVTGALVPNENLPAYVQALRNFIETPTLVERLGQQARRHVETAFPFEAFIAKYEAAYLDAMSGTADVSQACLNKNIPG